MATMLADSKINCDDYKYEKVDDIVLDCVVSQALLSEAGSDIFVKDVLDGNGNGIKILEVSESINFNPPNPSTTIRKDNTDYTVGDTTESKTEIIISSKSDIDDTRNVLINTSGLIQVN